MGNRICRSHAESDEESTEAFPAQAGLDLDWNDEASVHRRTAMNCLDNYALGKIVEESLVDPKGSNLRKPKKNVASLKFADQLEQAPIFEYSEKSESFRRRAASSSNIAEAC